MDDLSPVAALGRPSSALALRKAFAAADPDGTGKISCFALKKAIKILDPKLLDSNVDGLLYNCQLDNEGNLRYDEFVDWVCGSAGKGQANESGTGHSYHDGDSFDKLLSMYKKLPPHSQSELFFCAQRLTKLNEATEFFSKRLAKTDRQVVTGIMDACNQSGEELMQLDADEFKLLHACVAEVVSEHGASDWDQANADFHSDPIQEFFNAKLNRRKIVLTTSVLACKSDWAKLNYINDVEVAFWLKRLFGRVSEHAKQEWKKRFPQSSGGSFGLFLRRVELRCRAKREADKFIKAMDFQRAMHQYGVAFREMQKRQDYQPLRSWHLPGADFLMQPGGHGTTFYDLVEQGSAIMKKVDDLSEELRASIGAPLCRTGPMKAEARALQKIARDYNNEARRLTDVVRFSVVCYNLDMVRKAIQFLQDRSDIDVVRIKSGFDPSTNSAMTGGYRDCKVNCAHRSNGHIFEVQLHVLSFYLLKREGGHALYKWARQFAVQGIVSAYDVLENLSPQLLQEISTVVREHIQAETVEAGDKSMAVISWMMALAQLARITHNGCDLQYVNALMERCDDGAILAATPLDRAEIRLLAGQSRYFEVRKSLELVEVAKRAVSEDQSLRPEEWDDTEILFLARCDHAIGSCHYTIGKQLDADGQKEAARHHLQKAREHYEQSIERFGLELLSEHPSLLSAKKNLGDTLARLGHLDTALAQLHDTEQTLSAEVGSSHLQVGKVCHSLGEVYQLRGQFREAIEYFERASAIRRDIVGSNHEGVAKEHVHLAQCKKECGDVKGASRDLRRAMAIFAHCKHGTDSRRAVQALKSLSFELESERNSSTPVCVATLNFLGNAYNPMEFMSSDADFHQNYQQIRRAFAALNSADVVQEAVDIGFAHEFDRLLVDLVFERNCTKEFLARDNKLDLGRRTNMIVAGMMPTETGEALFNDVEDWRTLMQTQIADYDNDPEMVLWDIACNLAAERCLEAYLTICRSSYLNVEAMDERVATLLEALPTDGRRIVCAVQEFPEEGSAKFKALQDQLLHRGLKFVKPDAKDSSVGFLLSADIDVLQKRHAPLGTDPQRVHEALGLLDSVALDKSTKESLRTTCLKSMSVDLVLKEHDPAVRFVNVHAKEFKTDEGVKLLAKYLQQLANPSDNREAVVLLDANTAAKHATVVFDTALRDQNFQVLSPAAGAYKTTRKQRSEMHGQIYDERKCLKVVEAHKTYAAFMPTDKDSCWTPSGNARQVPDLREDPQNLPSRNWPTDHCMLQFELLAVDDSS